MMIGRHHGSKLAGATLAALGQRAFATASAARGLSAGGAAAAGAKHLWSGPARGAATAWLRAPAIGLRHESTLALGEKEAQQDKRGVAGSDGASRGEKAIASYWGVEPSKVTKGDGTEWRWTCFRVTCIFFVFFALFAFESAFWGRCLFASVADEML